MTLQQAIQALAEAMRPDELHTNDDGYTAKLNKLMATKAGRAKLRAALDSIEDEEPESDEDEDEEESEVTTNALAMHSAGYFSQKPDPERHAVLKGRAQTISNSSDGPLGMPRPALLDKSKREVQK